MMMTTKRMTTKDHQWQGNLLDYLAQDDDNDNTDDTNYDDSNDDDKDDDDEGPLVAG